VIGLGRRGGGRGAFGPLEFLLCELFCGSSRRAGFVVWADYSDAGYKVAGFLGSRDLSVLRFTRPEAFGGGVCHADDKDMHFRKVVFSNRRGYHIIIHLITDQLEKTWWQAWGGKNLLWDES